MGLLAPSEGVSTRRVSWPHFRVMSLGECTPIVGEGNSAEKMRPGKGLGITVLLFIAPMMDPVERDFTAAISSKRSPTRRQR